MSVHGWVTTQEAADILSQNSGRKIGTAYVRQMAEKHMIKTKKIDKRTRLYWKKGLENYVVRRRPPRGQGKRLPETRKKKAAEKTEETATLAD